jgi:Family of unknown function (DUF6463)
VRSSDPRLGEGALLRLLALAHAAVGVAFYRRELGAIGRDGVLAGVPYRGPKATAFWFLVPSPLVWIIGGLVAEAEEANDWNAVRAAHRFSLASALVAVVLQPVSGFWGWLAISLRSAASAR